jgi:hypothetical protein
MRSAVAARCFTRRLLQDSTLPPLIRFSGQRPSQDAKAEAFAKPADIGADLGQHDLRGGCADSGDVGEINAGNAVNVTPQIELRIVALAVIGHSLGPWWHGILGRAGKSLHQTCRLLIQLPDQLLVVAVSRQRLLQGEQMLMAGSRPPEPGPPCPAGSAPDDDRVAPVRRDRAYPRGWRRESLGHWFR